MSEQNVSTPAIILVDDDDLILLMLHRVLRPMMAGFVIVPVSDGVAALAQVAQRPVPLVITDYAMPGMNGLQLASAIKSTSPQTRVMMISAHISIELARASRHKSIDVYLPKPFSAYDLEEAVRQVLPVI